MKKHCFPLPAIVYIVCVDDGLIYESASAASRKYGIAKSALIELCLGQRGRKTVGGRKFEYVRSD